MINIKQLKPKDVGRWVVYRTYHSREEGRIKSWNDHFVFVVYKCDNDWDNFQDYTAAATNPKALNWKGTKMDLCSDGHDEVCFETRTCPACSLADEKNDEISDLQTLAKEQKQEIDDLSDQINNMEVKEV